MNIELSSEVGELVQRKIASGRYASASDVVQEALALLEERGMYSTAIRSDVAARIEEGYASLRCGEGVDGEAVLARLEEKYERLTRNQA